MSDPKPLASLAQQMRDALAAKDYDRFAVLLRRSQRRGTPDPVDFKVQQSGDKE